jgi:flagellar assembly factor FliW
MIINTRHFGELNIRSESVISFPSGIPGFPELKRFVLIDIPNREIGFLQAIDDPGIAFAVIDPIFVCPDYQITLSEEDIYCLEKAAEDELQYLSIITIPSKVQEMTANLMAPIVINPKKMLARQVIQTNSKYQIRHRIFPDSPENDRSEKKETALRKIG